MYLKKRQYLMVNSDIGVTPNTYILLGRVTADVRDDTRHLQTVNLVVSLSQILTSRLRGSLSEDKRFLVIFDRQNNFIGGNYNEDC